MSRLARICLLALALAVLATAPSATFASQRRPPVSHATERAAVAPTPVRRRAVTRGRAVRVGARAARLARHWLGTPYVWGGASPSGFDCSGLTSFVYRKLGVTLPHNAAAQWSVGRPVARDRLRPGDLVFFSGLGHVGLYVGRGRMIHAPQSGERVRVTLIASRASSYVGARRVA